MDHLKKANKQAIEQFASSNPSEVQAEVQVQELNVVRFNAAIQRIQAVIESKVKT